MLTRPAQRDVTSARRAGFRSRRSSACSARSWACWLVAAVLWLYQLQGRIQEQNESLQALTRLVEQSAASQRLVSDTLLEKVGGENPAEFTARYERAAKARDDALRQLAIQRSINETLGSQNKELETRAATLAAELETAQESARSVREGRQGRPQAPRADRQPRGNQRAPAESSSMSFDPWLESPDGKKALEIQRDLVRTRYAAYAGWGCSVAPGPGPGRPYFLLSSPRPRCPDERRRPARRCRAATPPDRLIAETNEPMSQRPIRRCRIQYLTRFHFVLLVVTSSSSRPPRRRGSRSTQAFLGRRPSRRTAESAARGRARACCRARAQLSKAMRVLPQRQLALGGQPGLGIALARACWRSRVPRRGSETWRGGWAATGFSPSAFT